MFPTIVLIIIVYRFFIAFNIFTSFYEHCGADGSVSGKDLLYFGYLKLEGSVEWLLLCFLWQSFAAHIDFNEHQGGSNGSSAALFVN